jgi:hypothetical protein
MDRRQIALKLAADACGLDFRISTFEDRLILQKAVYLMQAAGVHLGHYYQWYLHGPYSPSLTRDVYAVSTDLTQGLDDSRGWTLDQHSMSVLERLRGLVRTENRSQLARKLELLASIHFLITRQQVTRPNDDAQIAEVLRRFGKDFGLQDVEGGRRELCEHELLC